MSNFTHILFDLDGTLTDNTQGILNSLKYALSQMHIDHYDNDLLKTLIGPPLQWGFSHVFGMNERNTKLAVEHFRTYYGEHGWHQNTPYQGIIEMLAELDYQGKKMFVATAKLEKFAERIIRHFEMDRYILKVKGADYNGKHALKSQLIESLLYEEHIRASKSVVMVGDTVLDIEGGNQNGLTTVAVGYGFGKEEDLRAANPDYFVESVTELYELLAGY